MQNYYKLIFSGFLCGVVAISPAWGKKKTHHHHHHYANSQAFQSAHAFTMTNNMTADINRIIQNFDPNSNIGIKVKSMRHGDILYTHNETRGFMPASTVKILTAESALIYLGPSYTFSTRFLTDAQNISNGTLYGNLYLVNSGDPTFDHDAYVDLFSQLRARGIHAISGNVYIDTSAYDQVNYASGWNEHDKQYCFSAPVNAGIFDRNCLMFKIAPSSRPGYAAQIISEPKYLPIRNTSVTQARRSRDCNIHMRTLSDNTIAISGCLPLHHPEVYASAVIVNSLEYNKGALGQLLRNYDIQVSGSIAPGIAPTAHLYVLATHQSKPLAEIINEMLKRSDNLFAESLFKKMGQLYTRQPGSWENGGIATGKILQTYAAVDPSRLNLIDGSGLSRYNQVTAAQLMQALDYAYHDDKISSAFINALPIAGIDGTLRHRLKNISRKVRAKTGYINGVAGLAGYVVAPNKEPLGFVILANGHPRSGKSYRELVDRITTYLSHYSRPA